MSYASAEEIVDEFKRLDITSSDASVNEAKITRFLEESSAEIDTFISARYVLPISGTSSLLFLKKICIDLVTFRVTKIISIKKAIPDSNGAYQEILEGKFYNEANLKLRSLSNGKIKLPDAESLSGHVVRSYNRKNNIKPFFRKEERQW